MGALPNTYLGLPLGAPYKSIASWNPIVSCIQKRFARWKGGLLSKGGKVVLIKSVLASLLTYHLSLLSISRTVENKIEQCQRDFLWGKGSKEKGMHLVAWEDVYKPKKLGGLGLPELKDMNRVLLFKCL